MMRSSRLAPLLGLLLAACMRTPAPTPEPLPEPPSVPAVPDARTLAVYRTVADSIYARLTDRPIAVVRTTIDTACATLPCRPLADRMGVGSIWWQHADSTEADAARRSFLDNVPVRYDLGRVPEGSQSLIPIDAERVPIPGSDVGPWIAFRDGNHAAVGALHFSGVGFGRSGRSAIVYVDWRCGPSCGHTMSVTLAANPDSSWRIDDMLLLSSLRPD
jgi:hypothetical protein